MDRRKRTVLCLALFLALAMAAGAQGQDGKVVPVKTTLNPPAFSYWVPLVPMSADIIKDWNETASMQEMERKTGLHINFIHPASGQEQQSFNLMIASGDLPDMIQEREQNLFYPGGADKAIADGFYLDLTKLIDQYAPNYKKWMAKNPMIAKLTLTDGGKRWGMFHITDGAEPAWTGYAIRKDWLDELGLKAPVTLDDWYNVLTAFKQKKKVQSPLLVFNTGVPPYNHIISAFDVGGGFYQVNGAVKFGPMQPGYKEYLTLMSKWYKEGLLDPDFMGRTDPGFQVFAPVNLVATGKTGIFPEIWGYTANSFVLNGIVKDAPNFYIQALQSPKKTPGQQIHFNYPSYEVRSAVAITKACKDPVAAVKYLDQMYGAEGANIISYGAEGDTFVLKDGKPVFTDKVVKPTGAGATPTRALYKAVRWDGPGIVDYKRMWQISNATGQAEMLKALDVWKKDDISYVMPPITLTAAEARENSNIMPDVTTYVNEMTIKFIIGTAGLGDFDAFVSQIKGMKIDRALQIQQAAFDRFNARK